jgi:hypothetical protein
MGILSEQAMTHLIELGATQLIEMGAVHTGTSQIRSPVLDLFQVVSFIEDPYAGVDVDPGESISPKQRAIAEQLRTISRMKRRALVNPRGLQGLGYLDLIGEMRVLAARLNGLADAENELGKFKVKNALKKVSSKVVKVVKSPAFLSVVGVAANLIPGVGQVASAALMSAAKLSAERQQKKAIKVETRRIEAEQSAAVNQEQNRQLDAYYAQYRDSHFTPLGYTPEVWAKLTVPQKTDAAQKLSEGKLKPYATVSGQSNEVAQAAALSAAMQNQYAGQLPGEGVNLATLPPAVQAQAQALTPQYEQQIQAAGKDNFMAAALKATGQGSAIGSFFSGAGAELPGGMADMFSRFGGDAKEAGMQDIKNLAAGAGAGETVEGLLGSGFPWVPVVVGVAGSGLLVVGLVLADVI